ncbi:hypothetical protein ACFQ08_22670, partial [Streptosporangium algeriense]
MPDTSSDHDPASSLPPRPVPDPLPDAPSPSAPRPAPETETAESSDFPEIPATSEDPGTPEAP